MPGGAMRRIYVPVLRREDKFTEKDVRAGEKRRHFPRVSAGASGTRGVTAHWRGRGKDSIAVDTSPRQI